MAKSGKKREHLVARRVREEEGKKGEEEEGSSFFAKTAFARVNQLFQSATRLTLHFLPSNWQVLSNETIWTNCKLRQQDTLSL